MTEFRIQAHALRRAVQLAQLVTQQRNAVPILSFLRLAADGGALTIRATNLEQHLVQTVAGDGDLPATTADASRLSAMLSLLPKEETVALSIAKEGQLVIQAGPLRARIATLPVEDFPDWAIKAEEAPRSLPAGALRRLLAKPRHAISTEETRYYLNGIHIGMRGDLIAACATDGHRLFIAEEAPPEGMKPLRDGGFIIPRGAITAMLTLLAGMTDDEAVSLILRRDGLESQIAARSWAYRTKHIDGTFPNYEAVIPKADGVKLEVAVPARLARDVQLAAAISTERSKPVKLTNGTGNTVTLSAQSVECGDASVTVAEDVAAWKSNQVHPEFGVQARYLRETCAAMPRGFTMHVLDGSQPVRCIGDDGLAILMPMRV